MKQTYTAKERNMYLLGLLGQNMIYNIIAVAMTYYFQSVIFIPTVAIGILMAAARVWDAINDPMMGTVVDRTRTKWGKCRPYLIVMPGIIFVTTMLTFINARYDVNGSTLSKVLIIGWAAVSYILWGMSYTVGDIPIWGITALMTNDENDRNKLLSLARIVAGIGGGIVLLTVLNFSQDLGNKLGQKWNDTSKGMQWGFILVALALTFIATAFFQCAAFAKERVKQPSDEHKGFIDSLKIMWGCMPFRRILISGIIKAPMQIITIVAMTLLSYYYGDNGSQNYFIYLIVVGGGVFIGMFIAMALVPKLTEKFEKRTLYNVFTAASSIPFALLFVFYLVAGTELYKPFWVIMMTVMFLLAGGAIGATNVLMSVMIADCIDYDEDRTGYRPDGVFFSGQSFITKLGAGISSLIQSAIFAAVGFSDRNVELANQYLAEQHQLSETVKNVFATSGIVNYNGAVIDFPAYRLGMFLLISIPAAVTCIISILPMLKYELTNEKSAEILERLNTRRAEKED